jgi:hypothetical protein
MDGWKKMKKWVYLEAFVVTKLLKNTKILLVILLMKLSKNIGKRIVKIINHVSLIIA